MLRIYFDTCCLMRPLDDRGQVRVALEAEAILALLQLAESKQIAFVSSSAVELEISKTPDEER